MVNIAKSNSGWVYVELTHKIRELEAGEVINLVIDLDNGKFTPHYHPDLDQGDLIFTCSVLDSIPAGSKIMVKQQQTDHHWVMRVYSDNPPKVSPPVEFPFKQGDEAYFNGDLTSGYSGFHHPTEENPANVMLVKQDSSCHVAYVTLDDIKKGKVIVS